MLQLSIPPTAPTCHQQNATGNECSTTLFNSGRAQWCQRSTSARSADAVCKHHGYAKRKMRFQSAVHCYTVSRQDLSWWQKSGWWASLQMTVVLRSGIHHDVSLCSNHFNYADTGLAPGWWSNALMDLLEYDFIQIILCLLPPVPAHPWITDIFSVYFLSQTYISGFLSSY